MRRIKWDIHRYTFYLKFNSMFTLFKKQNKEEDEGI